MNIINVMNKVLEMDSTMNPYEVRRVLKWNESGCVTHHHESVCDCSKPLQIDKSEQKVYDRLRVMGMV